ncbi:hypothetical protein GA707_08350 [Nostocoides sp. F2B08]|uniref:hypothetical protein n=1 Tax=Nostocoides sp. F2B08 TaxID=2653936 RepID=UPI001263CDCA|nr:hypothetical protein [Tetrasphaera sp. F2B08]KAB7744604.1 hypothetical protein GA707_08350 [Tetrasphaera sp. F2B08]
MAGSPLGFQTRRFRMISPATTTAAPPDPAHGSTVDPAVGSVSGREEPAPPLTVFTELFPPTDADVAGHRSWLARSPWPEVVFASAR